MTKYLLTLLPLCLFLTTCGTYQSSGSYSNSRSFNSGLPANPDPDKCYVRVVTLDEYTTNERQLLTYSPEEARKYPHREDVVTLKAEISQWETTTYEGCESDNPNDCQVLCYRTYPGVYETIYSPHDTTLGNPFLKTLVIEKLVKKGGLSSYDEIDCKLTSYQELPITFEPGSGRLSGDSHQVIDDWVLVLLDDNPDYRFQLNVHTDPRGAEVDNMQLSERRAKSIVDYLVSKGMQRRALVSKPLGGSQPKNGCGNNFECPEADYLVNNRVEFRVLSIDN